MKIVDTTIPDVKVILPNIYYDSRGYFLESFNQLKFE